jgi:hypothetical protein
MRCAPLILFCLLTTNVLGQTPADASRNSSAVWHWRLAGILIDSDLHLALFAQGGDTRSLVVGDEIDGWTLAAVHRRDVMLRNANQEMTLGLEGLPPEIEDAIAQAKIKFDAATQAVEQASRQQQQDQATAETALAHATQAMHGGLTR